MKDMTLNRDRSGLTRGQTDGFGDSHHRWTGRIGECSRSQGRTKAVPKPGEEHAANSASFIADNFGISKELADRLPGEGIGIAVPAPQNRLILIQLTDGSGQYPHIAEGVARILS
jgi:hypothetical protein